MGVVHRLTPVPASVTCPCCDELHPRCTPCPCRGLQYLYPHWVRVSVWLALLAFCGACWWGVLQWLL